jgi:hypothetical protein
MRDHQDATLNRTQETSTAAVIGVLAEHFDASRYPERKRARAVNPRAALQLRQLLDQLCETRDLAFCFLAA